MHLGERVKTKFHLLMNKRTRDSIITFGSFWGLLLGFVFGLILKNSEWVENISLFKALDLAGKTWINLIILIVIPLIVSYMIFAVFSMINTKVLGRLGGYALWVHSLILIAALVFTVVFGFASIGLAGDHIPKLPIHGEIVSHATGGGLAGSYFSIDSLIDINAQIQKILGRGVIVLIALSILFAALVARFLKPMSGRVLEISKNTSARSMKWLQAFLLSMPLAVFVFTFPMAAKTGFSAVGVAGSYVMILSALLLVFLGIIYLIVHYFGSERLGVFARGMFSSQIVAMGTRSSLATIPILMQDAESKMGIPRTISAIIIPFFVSLFRLNGVISSPFKFIFLMHVYQIRIDPSFFLFFLLFQFVESFGSPGIPGGGKYLNLNLYLAAGIPMEGYILTKAVDAIPDIFKTLLNVTEVMAVATIVAKKARWKSGENLI